MPTIRVGLAQINTVVGDLPGNVARIVAAMGEAEAQGCDVLALPELAVTGYPPEDLLLRPSFVRDNLAALDEVVAGSGRCVTVVGFVDSSSAHDQEPARAADAADGEERSASSPTRPVIYNAAAVCAGGELLGVLPQAGAAQLLGVRRAAVLHPGRHRPRRSSRSPGCRSACRSARTPGPPTARSPTSAAAVPAWS